MKKINNENLCVICLEDLNEDIMDVCHKCNVKCHIKCLYDWYKKIMKKFVLFVFANRRILFKFIKK